MPRHYTLHEKVTAMTRLAENRGNVPMTTLQLGIPARTLREWRQQDWLEKVAAMAAPFSPSPPPPTPPAVRQLEELPPFANDLEAVNFMRRQMLDDLVEISRQLRQDFAYATPYQRMVIIPQLLDRLMKMDQLLKPYTPKQLTDIDFITLDDESPFDEMKGRVEFIVVTAENRYGSYKAFELMEALRKEHAFGYKPSIVVRFLRPTNNEEVVWQGTLTLTKEPQPR